MLFIHVFLITFGFLARWAGTAWGDVVINELHYNPADDTPTEFVELFNPTSQTIPLRGYSFTSGIFFSFPNNALIRPGEYILVTRFPQAPAWQNLTVRKYGPYNGELPNGGGRILLRSPDGQAVDEVEYDDKPPWPRGADEYGSSLERIAPDLPGTDPHSWRASMTAGGTPGARNSVAGTPPRPLLAGFEVQPPYPTSRDDVHIQVTLDSPDIIASVNLRIEPVRGNTAQAVQTVDMTLLSSLSSPDAAVFQATAPPQPSQTLVRMGVEVRLVSGDTLYLPHPAEPRPFESYFVYDHDIPSELPIFWIHQRVRTMLPPTSKTVSGVAVKSVTGDHVQVFDGARIETSLNGNKIKFLKREEYQGNRTLNLIPERPPEGTTAGPRSPHVEQLSFQIFRDFGVLAPQTEWIRVIDRNRHTQRIVIQQPNEKFLELNGRDPTGNIYKIAYNEPGGYTKMTNVLEGDEDFQELMQALNAGGAAARALALRRYLDIEEVMSYEVASVLMSNWDGFHNNLFLYHNPIPIDRWECIPWDLDKTFGYANASSTMFVRMPLTFPLDGRAEESSREPGRISRPFHQDAEMNAEYIRRLGRDLNGLFSEARIGGLIDGMEDLLLRDLDLLEQYTQKEQPLRRQQIRESHDLMRIFLQRRHAYLRSVLPVAVEDWSLY
ncbi:MAG: CotH kinase family protein [bacterium]